MQDNKETPEQKRERLRLEGLKRYPTGSMNDAFNRVNSAGLVDLAGSLGWKGMGILTLVIILGVIIYSVFFR